MVLALSAQNGWKVHQMDVKSTFLNGDLQGQVYMSQPHGFELKGKEPKFCKLIKALYGLKQAPKAWYAKMDDCLLKVSFQKSESDDTICVRIQGKNLVILVMYVDDLIITGNNDDHIVQAKKKLHARFKMTNLVLLHYYLGVEVFQDSNNIFINQCKYASKLLKGQEQKFCKLIRELYGLKKAPRSWYAKMDDYLHKVSFQRSEYDDTINVRPQGKNLVILVMYVDDLIITGNNDDHIV
jgi:ABC-type microcin C transport system permease subunit YejB